MINNVRERNPMPEQAREVRCTNFNEVALGYTEADAIREAMRCLNCRKKPCVAGCPIHQQIPEFIARVAEGDFEGAYDIITVRSTMPSTCGAETGWRAAYQSATNRSRRPMPTASPLTA